MPRARPVAHFRAVLLALGVLAATTLAAPVTARAADLGTATLAGATSVGLHNTYNDTTVYPYLADALDSGASLIELDAWPNLLTHKWNVSHTNPLGSSNNCVQATTAANLYTGNRNQNLDSCLDDIRIWLAAHPGHNPIMVKLELKAGFDAAIGLDATELDSYVAAHLGSAVFTPADLLTRPGGGLYPDLDTAARAGNWPARAALAGKVVVEAIPGTVEQAIAPASTWTDVVEASHLASLYASGTIAAARIFPSVLNAQTGDPRLRYANASLRPWFVVFDGDAGTWVSDGNTQWYAANHYLVVATDAYDVTPALSASAPALADAQARVALLAADGASFVSTDWYNAPANAVLSEVLPRS
jgi:Phosphoinositide phospholipase C, Ca2+-dependent